MYLKFLLFLILCVQLSVQQQQQQFDDQFRNNNLDKSFRGTAELLPNYRRSRIVKEFSQDNVAKKFSSSFSIDDDDGGGGGGGGDIHGVGGHRSSSRIDGKRKKNYDHLIEQTQSQQKLSEKQKMLLDKIVERVARLGGSYLLNNETLTSNDNDNNQNNNNQNNNNNTNDDEPRNKKIKNDTQINTNINNGNKNLKQIIEKNQQQSPPSPLSTTITSSDKLPQSKTQSIIENNLNSKSSTTATATNITEIIFGNVNTSSIVDSLASDHAREDIYNQQFVASDPVKNKREPPTSAAKPTKYHYYPHNQHIYLLPECAIQQVCNAVYVRLNYTQPLCACPSRYRDPCSASINEDDLHTTKLIGDKHKKAITLAKTCESTTEMRECRSPRDWSLLALQNTRTGKSHYLVICRCPDHFRLEGPMAHDQPTYASVPGIRVFGMMCIKPGVTIRRPQIPKREKPIFYQHPYKNQHVTILPPQSISQTKFQQQQIYKQNQYQHHPQYSQRSDDGYAPIISTTENDDDDDEIQTTTFNDQQQQQPQQPEETFDNVHDAQQQDGESLQHSEQSQQQSQQSIIQGVQSEQKLAEEEVQEVQEQKNHRIKRNINKSTIYNINNNNNNNNNNFNEEDTANNEISSEISWHELKKLISDIQWD